MMVILPGKLKKNNISFVLIEPKGKKPFQQEWQKKSISYNSQELLNHLQKGGNYGVMGGGENNLIILDFDNKQVQEEVIKKLPPTLTIKTGSGLLHKYYFSDKSESFKIFDRKLATLVDVQGQGKQVVGPGSIHPNGNVYEIIEDNEIAYIDYDEIKAILMPYDKKPKKKEPKKSYEGIEENFADQILSSVNFEGLLSEFGVDTSKNPTNCPFHESKGGKCFGFTKDVAHCFHCDESWNAFSWIMHHKNCSFKDALEWLAEREGMTDKLEESRKEWAKRQESMSIFVDKQTQEKIFSKAQPYFYDRNGLWWLWNNDNFMWKMVDDVDMLNMISHAEKQDVINPKNRAMILNILKQEGRKKIPEPIKPTWIQFKDKIIDISTGEQIEASPKYFVTNPIPWALGESSDTPTMDRIFEEWVGKENVETLYEILAYCLLPSYPIHRIFCFIGEGLNGKSCYLNLLRRFLGKDNCASTELDTLLSSRFEVTRLHKKLVVQMGETNFSEMNKTSMLKKLSGGDLIGYEYKNKNPFQEMNYAKILIATNNLPSTTDKTIGFYRRWMIIDFPNKFSEKVEILEQIPDAEYNALARKCVTILKELLDRREFTNEGTIEQRRERYEAKSNFLEQFLHENTVEDVNGYITKADFYKKFISWCKENRHREMSENSVGISMRKAGVEGGREYFGWLYDGKGGQAKVWRGIRWKNQD